MASKRGGAAPYRAGAKVERRIVKELQADFPNILAARSAGSHSKGDVYIVPRCLLLYTWPQKAPVKSWLIGTGIGKLWGTCRLFETTGTHLYRGLALQVKGSEAQAKAAASKEARRGS